MRCHRVLPTRDDVISLSRTGCATLSPDSSTVASARVSIDDAPTKNVNVPGSVTRCIVTSWNARRLDGTEKVTVADSRGSEGDPRETDELATGSRHRGDVVTTVELHDLLAGERADVDDVDLDDRLTLGGPRLRRAAGRTRTSCTTARGRTRTAGCSHSRSSRRRSPIVRRVRACRDGGATGRRAGGA